MHTTVANKLIILRDTAKLSQQHVSDYLKISKSTYCRYEKGLSIPGLEEINLLLKLYDISYEQFMNISLPIRRVIVYPVKILDNLESELLYPIPDDNSYKYYEDRYFKIKDIVNSLLDISAEAMDFPDLNISDLPLQTTLKEVVLDVRGEQLIRKAYKIQDLLINKMHESIYK